MNSIHKERGTIYIPGESPTQIVEPEINSMDIYQKATWLGIVTGLRVMTPAALLAWSSQSTSAETKRLTGILAAGELIVDKLSFIPNRLNTGPFIGRLIVGAMSGALLCRRYKQSALQGAFRGVMGAALGTIAGYIYRNAVDNITGVPDVIWAIIEDGVTLMIGTRVVGLAEGQ